MVKKQMTSGEIRPSSGRSTMVKKDSEDTIVDSIETIVPASAVPHNKSKPTALILLTCVGGIYGSFLTWGVLQERITSTLYAPLSSRPEKFSSPVVLNTLQSIFACLLGYIYLNYTRSSTPSSLSLPIFPSRDIIPPLLLVATTASLASPFGYAALNHVDYITFTLAKSCKLLPVMFLHVTLFRKKYPIQKYIVVALVTLGVAVFTLYQQSHPKKHAKKRGNLDGKSSLLGLALLSVNLLFDGLTNATQDYINGRFRPYTGQQMMCGLNLFSTILTGLFLLLEPWLGTTALGGMLGVVNDGKGELGRAYELMMRDSRVGRDVFAFAACGALGQVFIFYTLATFGSLLLVTVTVTRKMLTMMLSVVWFGHKLTPMQWLGVGMVFGGVGLEAQLSKREKSEKELKSKGIKKH